MRNIFLGSAAAFLAAATGAQAADMMMDVKAPREPVYRCDITGFIELPGTDICFKVGGFARFDMYFGEDQYADPSGPSAWDIIPDGHSLGDTFNMYATGRINFDARTSTEYGTVRAFVEMQAYDNDTNSGGSFGLRHAFVQFGNWTFGKTWSTFLDLSSSPNYADPYLVVGDNYIRRNQIRYTQSFGNGFSFSVAIEDQAYAGGGPGSLSAVGLWSPWPSIFIPGCFLTSCYQAINDRNEVPDLVANIRVDGDWGSAQLSGAIHDNQYRDTLAWAISTDDDIGWAALFGLVVNAPSLAEGDYFTFKAIYTDGASQYTGNNLYSGANVIWGACSTLVVLPLADCIVDDTTSWSVLASFTHNWSPTVAMTVGGGYASQELPLTTWDVTSFWLASDTTIDAWELFANVSWTPVSRTTFMFDVHYQHIDFGGSNGASPYSPAGFAVPAPFAPWFFSQDEGAVTAAFQVTRTF